MGMNLSDRGDNGLGRDETGVTCTSLTPEPL